MQTPLEIDFQGMARTRYDEVNRSIHRIESEEEPAADAVVEELKKRPRKLKDEVASLLMNVECNRRIDKSSERGRPHD